MIADTSTTVPGAPRSDEDLVREAQAGQVRAFSVLVERNQGLARAIAYSVSSDYSVTEDLAQEAMVTAWLRLADLEEPGKFRPWLASIVRNTARYWRRHQGRHAPQAHYGLEVLEQIPDGAHSPLEQALQNETLGHARDALEGLAARHKEPLLLFYSMGESHAEVASVLGVSEAAVRQRLCRARKKLKQDVSGVERTGRRLRNQASVAASVLLMISSRQAWATHATRLGTQSVFASPKLFMGLGALAGGALVACVGAVVLLLGGNETAVAESAGTRASRDSAPSEGAQQVSSSRASAPTQPGAPLSAADPEGEPRGLVRIGSGKVKEKGSEKEGASALASAHEASNDRQDAASADGSARSGRIKKHGPAHLVEGTADHSVSKPLLRPTIDMGAVNRELWSED